MRPRSDHRIVVPAILLSLLLGVSAAAFAAPGDRKTLLLRGRVTDAEGWPVAGARITAQGTRRSSSTGDDDGQFVLNLPLGSLSDLARNPIALRVHAEQRGWRLALPGGEAEMGLELRVVAGGDGVARCEVRSNQPKVASAIVRALTADGDATGVAILNFIGLRGEAIGSSPAPDLPVVDRVALAGVRVPIAPPPGAEPVGRSGAKQKGASAAEEESAKPKRSEKSPTRKTEPIGQPVTAVPARPGPSAVVSPVPSDAERELAESKRRASQERSHAREEARRLREQTRERDRLARLARAEEKSHAMEEEKALRAAEEELRHGRAGQQDRWDALRREVHMIAGAHDTAAPPPVAALDHLAGAPSRAEQRTRVLPAPRLMPRRDTVAVRSPQPLPEPPPVVPVPVVSAPVTSPPVDPAPTSPAASATESGVSRVHPRPEGESRTRTGPLVIRVPGPRPTAAATRPAAGDSCTCRIEGTVEVDSERPLPGRTRVAVSLVWYPAIADTVELFMGSPRGFSLPVAPCGPQRLRLVNLGALRFDVNSRDAMAGFRCEPGRLHQFHIVLQPR